MKLANISTVYFLGVGGIGMSALARYFKLHGCAVSGYDKTKTPLTSTLEKEGIAIHYSPDSKLIPSSTDLVVYTPAVSATNPEWEAIQKMDVATMKRAEVLGLISNSGNCLAVAGTHGKTTTSAILSHIFKTHFAEVNAFVGGILSNYQTNFLYSENTNNFVVEADEFDRSFLHLEPNFAVINSVDADHLDIYGKADALIDSFQEFAKKIRPGGALIKNVNIQESFKVQDVKLYTFGIDCEADFSASNVNVINGQYHFNYHHSSGTGQKMVLSLPGVHNVENAVAASAIATLCGISDEEIAKAIHSFSGVKRRFEITRNQNGLTYVDDYAHHPTEIAKVLESAREMYAGKKLSVIFQPHLYSRTRDFEGDFAKELSKFDEVLLLDIYPARELPIEGVTSERLLSKITNKNKTIIEKSAVIEYIKNNQIEVLFTLGAGDIDTLVEPIKALVTA
ncbi:MAG: UDP-N-acetylmuramate--L-alanine ligase [Salibacteraceae bacterium]